MAHEINITLPLNYKCRPYQKDFWEAAKTFKRMVLVWHRRAGKEKTCWNYMVMQACKKVGIYYYFFPHFSQGRKILWDGIDKDGFRFLDHIPKELLYGPPNSTEMKIRLRNGSIIQIVGTNNIDSIVGTNPVGCVFSEYSLQDPIAWQLIRPILAENKGWAVFNFTPRGANHAKELYDMAIKNPEWFAERLTVEDTGVVTEGDLDQERKAGMSEDFVQQEFYCFPDGQFVMTSVGMKDIKYVVVGDLVYTHSGRFRAVVHKHERFYEGSLIRIKSYGSSEDIFCTPNHPIRTYLRHSQTYRWMQAKDLKRKDRLCFPKIASTNEPVSLVSKSLALLIAWYITEGSASENHVILSLKSEEEATRSISFLNDLGISYSTNKNRTSFCVNILNVVYVDFLKTNCGLDASNKRIPMTLIRGYEEEFLRELMLGDGCSFRSRNSERWYYTTISKTLAYQVQTLAHSCGFTGGISKRPAGECIIEGRHCLTKESYQVGISPLKIREESDGARRSKFSVIGSVLETEEVVFSGTVYNLKVQYDESYTVNGRAVHNCSFTLGVEGSYYAKYVQNARDEGRVARVGWNTQTKVNTAWDIGYGDSTCIIWYQIIGQEIAIVDFYEAHGEGLSHYVKIVKDKPYIYGDHYAPHDIDSHDFSSGLSAKEVGASLGLKFITLPTLKISIDSGIEAVRGIFPRVWIDEGKCAGLIKCLENYRKEFDSRLQVYKNRPLHDKYSHGADAMRYLAIAVKRYVDLAKEGVTDKQASEWYDKFNPMFE